MTIDSEKPAWVWLDSSICLSHFVNVLGVAFELDQSPKTLTLLEEESHAVLAWFCDSDSEESHTGLDVFHLRVSKNHRQWPPIDAWWSDQGDTDLMPFRIQIQNLKLMVRWGYLIPWSQLAQEQSMMLHKARPCLWQSTALRRDRSPITWPTRVAQKLPTRQAGRLQGLAIPSQNQNTPESSYACQ